MTEQSRKPPLKEVPEVVTNVSNQRRYVRGRFLGKGGFARCYELTEMETRTVFAGKIVSKTLLTKKHQKDKMTQEIAIHRSLAHPHVVRLDGFFEDNDNVYILLELCARRSLMELHKRRRAVSEPEARYFVHQIVDACKYLHDKRVIHRDLKLGNLFLNDEMQVKIGDFGLATTLEYDGERKKTLCGTPNYIAPEMLGKKGHSFEVDIWAIGCILYTLLVGKPPFETQSLKDTYQRIKKNEYHIPSRVGPHAEHLLHRLLAAEPSARPNIHEILDFEFFTQGYLPARLPTSCLTMAPKFPSLTQLRSGSDDSSARRALGDVNRGDFALSPKEKARKDLLAAPVRPLNTVPESGVLPVVNGGDAKYTEISETPTDFYLSDLYRQLTQLVNSRPSDRQTIQEDEAEDPASTPVFWVSKWVDYSDKYGLGYQLCDNSVGVLFNDSTKLVLDAAGEQVQYIDRNNQEFYYTINNYPNDPETNKKITLLKYFRNYMNEHLLKAGANMMPREGDELARLPCLRTWFRTRSAIVLHMTNGTLQVNFFNDHTKLIVCPLMGAATYIDQNRQFRTLKFTAIEQFGCSKDVFTRVRYARTMVERLLTTQSSSRPGALSSVQAMRSSVPTPSHQLAPGPASMHRVLSAPSHMQ